MTNVLNWLRSRLLLDHATIPDRYESDERLRDAERRSREAQERVRIVAAKAENVTRRVREQPNVRDE